MIEQSRNNGKSQDALPRYQQVAAALMADIESGRSPVGSLLKTEYELCDEFNVSRYTVREALRLLFEAGLVSRRRGAGTVVIATKQPPTFNHALDSIDDLMEYAKETRMEFSSVTNDVMSKDLAERFGLPIDKIWIKAIGLRYKDLDPRPVCLINTYVDQRLEGIQKTFNNPPRTIAEIVEEEFDIHIVRIEQMIEAVALAADQAKTLKADVGGPGLRIVRRFLDEHGQTVQLAESIYPASRVTISMSFDRGDFTPQ
ncbi:MAG: GntR family transcriptional regulator [Alphaproteobacteria bacterium]|nr:MAG: GntR family transcriptional regulator [Alphaproteobacteria bacterium]